MISWSTIAYGATLSALLAGGFGLIRSRRPVVAG